MIFEPNIQAYIESNVRDSLLLQSFVNFIFKEEREAFISTQQLLNENRTSFRTVATLGFLVSENSRSYENEFFDGVKRQMGRRIDLDHSLLYDNISLMGIFAGVFGQKLEKQPEIKDWLMCILNFKSKIDSQKKYSLFFRLLYLDSQDAILDELKEIDKSLYLYVVTAKGYSVDSSFLSFYYNYYRGKTFPYYNDFFENIIAISNLDSLAKEYFSTRYQDLAFDKSDDRNKYDAVIIKVCNRVRTISRFSSLLVFTGLLVLVIKFMKTISLEILLMDWDWMEPRSYIIGIWYPIIAYLLLAINTLFFNDIFSIHPKAVIESLTTLLYKLLAYLLNLDIREIENLQNKKDSSKQD